MKKKLVLLQAFAIVFLTGYGQVLKHGEGIIMFHGLVIDARTEVPLLSAQIFINRSFVSASDSEGRFAFYTGRRDTVVFTCLGYKDAVLHVSDTLSGTEFIAGIYMHPDTITIGEVIIMPRMASLRSDILKPVREASPEMENARYNLAVSAYQGRVSQSRLGDPAMNYELLRQKQRSDAYSKGQIPPDRMIGVSPLLLIPAAYLLINGLPEKPAPLKPMLTDQEVIMIRKKYLESLRNK